MPTPTLRPSTASDAEFLYQIAEDYFRPLVEALGRKWSTTKMQEKCQLDAVSGITSIVEVDGQRVGYLSVERRPTEIWLDALILESRFRRQGIGTALVSDLRREAALRRLPIRLGVLTGNAAQVFWQQHGFTAVGAVDPHHALMESAT